MLLTCIFFNNFINRKNVTRFCIIYTLYLLVFYARLIIHYKSKAILRMKLWDRTFFRVQWLLFRLNTCPIWIWCRSIEVFLPEVEGSWLFPSGLPLALKALCSSTSSSPHHEGCPYNGVPRGIAETSKKWVKKDLSKAHETREYMLCDAKFT